MTKAKSTVSTRKFSTDDQGLSTPEYAMLLGLIVLVCFGSLELLSTGMNQAFSSVGNAIGQKPTVANDAPPAPPTIANSVSGP
ncbi:MAG: Flp family type IVb pilin [Aureliella sp.]